MRDMRGWHRWISKIGPRAGRRGKDAGPLVRERHAVAREGLARAATDRQILDRGRRCDLPDGHDRAGIVRDPMTAARVRTSAHCDDQGSGPDRLYQSPGMAADFAA